MKQATGNPSRWRRTENHMTTYHKEEIREPMPLGHNYDQEHAASADGCLQELRQDYNDLVDAYEAERTKVQVLRDALEQIAWKLEHKGDTPNGIQWAKIDRNDAAMSQVREALATTEGNAETCHCANCGTSDVSDSLLIECQGEPLCPECRPDDTEPTA